MSILQYGMPLTTIQFEVNCKQCSRGEGQAIPGCIQNGNLEKLRLVVISDYPGHYEVENKHCFYDNEQQRQKLRKEGKKLKVGWPNAGNYMRRKLENFGLDTYQEVYFTNALKCKQNSSSLQPNENTEVKRCVRKWLLLELDIIDSIHPSVPILLAGKYAFVAFKKFVPNSPIQNVKENSLRKCRRQVFWYKKHPLIVTVNPANACTSIPKLEYYEIEKVSDLKNVRELTPLIGSPDWHYQNDLNYLKPYL
jgi:uracil-DNA glycosylase